MAWKCSLSTRRHEERQRLIEINKTTDQLLEEIAAADNDTPNPQLLRKIIPDKKAFVRYLKQRGLLDDPAAQSILSGLDITGPDPTTGMYQSAEAAESAVFTAVIVEIVNELASQMGVVNEVARKTGIKKKDVHRVLDELVTITGREAQKRDDIVYALIRARARYSRIGGKGRGRKATENRRIEASRSS
jgi:hypothetical protein